MFTGGMIPILQSYNFISNVSISLQNLFAGIHALQEVARPLTSMHLCAVLIVLNAQKEASVMRQVGYVFLMFTCSAA